MSADKQSDKEIYLSELTPVSTKRRRTEEITLSQLQIEDYQTISNRIDSQSIRELQYSSYESEDTTDSRMELHILNVAPVDRYLHSLLQHNKLWRVTGTDIIVMCDYEDNEERQILRQFVIVIIKSLVCTTCQDTECLHANATQLSIDDKLFQEVGAKDCDGLDYYFLTDNSVILIENSIIHSFNCKITKCFNYSLLNIQHHFLNKLNLLNILYRKVIGIAGLV